MKMRLQSNHLFGVLQTAIQETQSQPKSKAYCKLQAKSAGLSEVVCVSRFGRIMIGAGRVKLTI